MNILKHPFSEIGDSIMCPQQQETAVLPHTATMSMQNKQFSKDVTNMLDSLIKSDKCYAQWGCKRIGLQLSQIVWDYKGNVAQDAIINRSKCWL